MPLKVTLEEPKNSALESYKEPWHFKLMAEKNSTVWGYHTVSVWGSCSFTVGQEKVKIFWKWRVHRWQIPLSVQMRLSKPKQPLSQRKKTNFPQIQPLLLPPFPLLLVHCQLTASSASSGSQKRSCLLLFPRPGYLTLVVDITSPFSMFSSLLFPLAFMVPFPGCNIMPCLSKRHYLSL